MYNHTLDNELKKTYDSKNQLFIKLTIDHKQDHQKSAGALYC